jgi:hypothetical protein
VAVRRSRFATKGGGGKGKGKDSGWDGVKELGKGMVVGNGLMGTRRHKQQEEVRRQVKEIWGWG